jgi:hypothetical protein
MQINRTGYFLVAFFFLGGLAFTIVEFTVLPFPILLGPIWMIVAVGLGIYAIKQRRKGDHEQWLWKTGIRGKGTLVSAGSHMQINEQPVLKMVLDVEVPGSGPRRVSRRVIVSNFAAPLMRPGLVLPVYVNPADPEDILIAW